MENIPFQEPEKETEDGNKEFILTFDQHGFHGESIDGLELIGDGSEFHVYRDGNRVIKIGEPYGDDETYAPRVRAALLLNEITEAALTHLGFYLSNNQSVRNPIFTQAYILGRPATDLEIQSHMQGLGFTYNSSKASYHISSLTVTDLDGDNCRIDTDGKLFILDACVQKN
jgi:hypothetical protein